MSAHSKGEYVQAIYQRYRRATRPEKRLILDEFCKVTGYHRKHAIRVLTGPAPPRSRLRRIARFRPRGPAGLAYWYAMLPFHGIVFPRMLEGIRRAAEQLAAPAGERAARNPPRVSDQAGG